MTTEPENRLVAPEIPANAAEFQLSLARALELRSIQGEGFIAVDGGARGKRSRIILTSPVKDGNRLIAELREFYGTNPEESGLILEDPFGQAELERYGFSLVWRFSAMIRGVSPLPAPDRQVVVARVRDEEALAEAERTIIEGFPLPDLRPIRHGTLLPVALLGAPGFTVWTVKVKHVTAAAAVAMTTGTSVGLYWVATLPEWRGRGLARTLLLTVLRAEAPGLPAVLTATESGLPLYESLGFKPVGSARWWRWRMPDRAALIA
ncbi:GNAT family N-acetyltransferase [Rhizohabitans arisaemae]|uniref:GNAT family N-acetyltransferase n=1 Tax=Rhizohabitans arisaemae TaxID=2720610 RepID=UPI0024B08120|nr:GNAT family N-acetyltransferase [Rhizohabitans arisaemae]